MFQKLCCFELRTGIIRYGILNIVLSSISLCLNLIFSMTDDNPEAATNQTFSTGANVLNVCMKGSMTYGAYKENRVFLMPYLILECMGLSILTIISVVFMFQAPILILLLLLCGLGWYVWLCVLSYYQLLDPRNPNHIIRTIEDTEQVVHVEQPPPYYENQLMNADAV